jgi:RNA polymerase sigma-70 factor (ECF subfamily)
MTEDDQNIEDKRLVAEAKQDLRAFNALYIKYLQPVYRYSLSRIGTSNEAEEAVSQTFLAALEGFSHYRDDGRFAAWLFSIARRKSADHFRRVQRNTVLSDTLPSQDADPLLQVEKWDRKKRLTLLINALTTDEQELLRLRFAAGLSFSQIAAILKENQGAVKKRLYRLLDKLHVKLEDNND